jgi:CRP-like cAMP-binding protein
MDSNAEPPSTKSQIFSGLSESAIESVLARAMRISVRPYTQLCRAGERASWFYVILHGQVKYCRTIDDGTEILVRVLSANECFGMGTFVAEAPPYLGTAETMTFCEILKWRAADILTLASTHHRLAQNALAIVMNYVADYSTRHAALVSESSTARLARVLIDLATRVGVPGEHGVDVRITNEDLGSLADVSRFTVSRTMSRWQKRHLIAKNRNHVAVLVPEGLLARAQERAAR